MKNIFSIFLLFFLFCSNSNNNYVRDKDYSSLFTDYIKNSILENNVYSSNNSILTLPSGKRINLNNNPFVLSKVKVTKQTDILYKPLFVPDSLYGLHLFYKNALVLTWYYKGVHNYFVKTDEIKKDLEYLTELLLRFSRKNYWNNRLLVYCRLNSSIPVPKFYLRGHEFYAIHLNFCYENNSKKLWTPLNHNKIDSLISQYGNIDLESISKNRENIPNLVKLGLGKISYMKFSFNKDLFMHFRCQKDVSVRNGILYIDDFSNNKLNGFINNRKKD